MAKINQKKFKEACKDSGGNQSVVAQRIGCTRQSISMFLKKNPKMKVIFMDSFAKVTDKAQSNNAQAISDGNLKVSQWWLDRHGEGFSLKQELQHMGEGLKIIIERADDGNDKLGEGEVETDSETADGPKSPE